MDGQEGQDGEPHPARDSRRNDGPSDMRAARWFYGHEETGRPVGPVSFQELKELWDAGTIARQTLVWGQGMRKQRPVGDVPGLVSALSGGAMMSHMAEAESAALKSSGESEGMPSHQKGKPRLKLAINVPPEPSRTSAASPPQSPASPRFRSVVERAFGPINSATHEKKDPPSSRLFQTETSEESLQRVYMAPTSPKSTVSGTLRAAMDALNNGGNASKKERASFNSHSNYVDVNNKDERSRGDGPSQPGSPTPIGFHSRRGGGSLTPRSQSARLTEPRRASISSAVQPLRSEASSESVLQGGGDREGDKWEKERERASERGGERLREREEEPLKVQLVRLREELRQKSDDITDLRAYCKASDRARAEDIAAVLRAVTGKKSGSADSAMFGDIDPSISLITQLQADLRQLAADNESLRRGVLPIGTSLDAKDTLQAAREDGRAVELPADLNKLEEEAVVLEARVASGSPAKTELLRRTQATGLPTSPGSHPVSVLSLIRKFQLRHAFDLSPTTKDLLGSHNDPDTGDMLTVRMLEAKAAQLAQLLESAAQELENANEARLADTDMEAMKALNDKLTRRCAALEAKCDEYARCNARLAQEILSLMRGEDSKEKANQLSPRSKHKFMSFLGATSLLRLPEPASVSASVASSTLVEPVDNASTTAMSSKPASPPGFNRQFSNPTFQAHMADSASGPASAAAIMTTPSITARNPESSDRSINNTNGMPASVDTQQQSSSNTTSNSTASPATTAALHSVTRAVSLDGAMRLLYPQPVRKHSFDGARSMPTGDVGTLFGWTARQRPLSVMTAMARKKAAAALVDEHVVSLKARFLENGIKLPVLKIEDCVYRLGDRKIHLSVLGGALCVKAGGGYRDFLDYLSRTRVRA